MILRICKSWNRDPDWFYTLEPKLQTKVLAEYRLSVSNPEQIKTRQDQIKRAKMEKMINRSIG